MEPEFNTEICVMGAGPAGTAIAKQLADMGYDVMVVESQPFPRPHVGICLSDETYKLLDYLGAKEVVAAQGFLKRNTTVVKWETEEPLLTPQPGFHVDRGVFDQLLLENARIAGAKVLQPARVISLQSLPTGGWNIRLEIEGESRELNTRFIVDAMGKSNVFPSKKVKTAPSLFALHATWELEELPDYDGFIEAGTEAWLWFALTGGNQCMISLFTDPKHFSNSKSTSLEEHYQEMMQQFTLMQYARLSHRVSEVKGCDASSRYSTDPIGLDYIRIGDANFSVDPMSSQGVHLALAAGVQAAVVVNTLIRYPDQREVAMEFFQNRQQERIKQFTEKSAGVYAQVAARRSEAFWHDRAGNPEPPKEPISTPAMILPDLTLEVQLSPKAKILPVPVMGHEFIESAPALHHPALGRPVAFLGGKNLVDLVERIQPGQSVKNVINTWAPEVPPELGQEIFAWLWGREILVAT